MTIHEMIAVLRAANVGKVIQARCIRTSSVWRDIADPGWDFENFDYRVKPAPREAYVLEVTRPEGSSVWSMITPEQWERLTPEDQAKWVRFVEAE